MRMLDTCPLLLMSSPWSGRILLFPLCARTHGICDLARGVLQPQNRPVDREPRENERDGRPPTRTAHAHTTRREREGESVRD